MGTLLWQGCALGVVDTDTRAKPENFVHYHACVFVVGLNKLPVIMIPLPPFLIFETSHWEKSQLYCFSLLNLSSILFVLTRQTIK